MAYDVYENGPLKSAVQKFVRRGMAEEAAATAVVLARRGLPLFQRLPIIAAEDVGWEFTAPVFNACQQLAGHIGLFGQTRDVQIQSVAKLARALARMPKDRDCSGLAGLAALANERKSLTPDLQALRGAIEAKDELLAMRHCERFAAGRQHGLVWDMFRMMAEARGGAIECHVEGIRGESCQGLLLGDELILLAAGIYALAGSKAERPFNWQSADGTVAEPKDWLPWYVFDMHTREGCEAKAELQRQGVDVKRLNSLWWYWESSLVDVEMGQLARQERIARGFDDQTQAEWLGDRAKLRAAVELRMSDLGAPIGNAGTTRAIQHNERRGAP